MARKRRDGLAAKLAALDELTTTAALLYFRMRRAAEGILGEGIHSSGRRSVLRSLERDGPQTVPQMARMRAVSRQHVQQIVNSLLDDRLVELAENPAHKRSRLVAITAAGERLAMRTAEREAELLPTLVEELSLTDLETTTRVLEHLKATFDSERWRREVARLRRAKRARKP